MDMESRGHRLGAIAAACQLGMVLIILGAVALFTNCSSNGGGVLGESTLPLRVIVGEYIGDDVSRAYRVRDTARAVQAVVSESDQVTVSQLRMEAETMIDWSSIHPTRRELIVELLDLIERRLQGLDAPPTVRLQELISAVELQSSRSIEYLEQ